jgi:hypothetical protein
LRGRLDRKFIYSRSFSVCLFRWPSPRVIQRPGSRPVAQHGVTNQLRTRNSRHISVYRVYRLHRVIRPEAVTPSPYREKRSVRRRPAYRPPQAVLG